MGNQKDKIKYDAKGNVLPETSPREKEPKAKLDSKRGILDEKNPDDFE
ncbi:hypothetical protein SAMN05192559_1208 [Halobacillus karajensis]|nr:hypothetical protein [Halobacillus karajensis]SEI14266.1 hypothetical protein SAMN05192559_1208 [Halobacillus karajensis]